MLPCSSTPWNPAITAISPAASASLIGWLSIDTIRARENELSVTILHWWPRNDRALPPAARIASATRPTETCSPVDTITSTSRSLGSSWISLASLSRRLGSPDIAHPPTATCGTSPAVARQRAGTLRMRSIEPTDVPPYFWTINTDDKLHATRRVVQARLRGSRGASLAAPWYSGG